MWCGVSPSLRAADPPTMPVHPARPHVQAWLTEARLRRHAQSVQHLHSKAVARHGQANVRIASNGITHASTARVHCAPQTRQAKRKSGQARRPASRQPYRASDDHDGKQRHDGAVDEPLPTMKTRRTTAMTAVTKLNIVEPLTSSMPTMRARGTAAPRRRGRRS